MNCKSNPFFRTLLTTATLATTIAATTLVAAPVRADDDDDDILSPVDDAKTPKPTKEPTEQKARKIGLAPLVPVGSANKALAEQVTSILVRDLAESELQAVSIALPTSSNAAKTSAVNSKAAESQQAGLASLKKGQGQLKKLNLSAAQKSFEQAVAQFEASAPVLKDVQPLIDAHFGLAEVYARQGDDAAAETALRNAACLNPEYEPDSKLYPPQFVRSFFENRDKVLTKSTATIAVDESAAGSTVYLDGRAVGTAPIKITNVPICHHVVSVMREDQGLFGTTVDTKSSATETVSPGLRDPNAMGPAEALAENRFSPDAARAVAEAARRAGVKEVLVGVVASGGSRVPLALVLINVETGQATRIEPISLSGDLIDTLIETLKVREQIAEVIADGFPSDPLSEDALLAGQKAAKQITASTLALKFKVKPVAKKTKSRVTDEEEVDEDSEDGEDGSDRVASGNGKKKNTAKKTRMADNGDDEDNSVSSDEDGDDGDRDVIAGGGADKKRRTKSLGQDDKKTFADPNARDPKGRIDEDLPITEQPWFLPTVIGGGLAGAAVLGVGTYGILVAADVVPNPLPRSGASVTVVVPAR